MASPFVTFSVIQKLKNLGLSESTLMDVFNHGEYKKFNDADTMVKKYTGFEVGLFYKQNPQTGEYVITHVWKRERR